MQRGEGGRCYRSVSVMFLLAECNAVGGQAVFYSLTSQSSVPTPASLLSHRSAARGQLVAVTDRGARLGESQDRW